MAALVHVPVSEKPIALIDLLDKPIRDPNGDAVARLQDLVVRISTPGQVGAAGAAVAIAPAREAQAPADLYPPVIGLVARLRALNGARNVFIPWERVRAMGSAGVELASPAVNVQRFVQRDGEILLRGGLWDRQVVDVEGRRIVRINDVDVAEKTGVWRLVAVDVGFGALVRRLPGGEYAERFVYRIAPEAQNRPQLIDWAMIIPVAQGDGSATDAVRLRVPRERLARLDPADMAGIVEQLTPQQGADLLHDFDDAHAADIIEELEDERQGQILRLMDPERAADVLDEMEPDEATDALRNVSEDEAADLIGRMGREEAADVQELLGYPDDSAGGIMTTEYISVPDWATVGDIVTAMRVRKRAAVDGREDPLPDAIPEVYVVAEDRPPQRPPMRPRPGARARTQSGPRRGGSSGDLALAHGSLPLEAEGRLLGVIGLRDLVLADPEAPAPMVMQPAECVAHPFDNERDVARVIADEDLDALPIVDDDHKLLGIVTVDDAIDVILPTAWKKRIPHRFR